MSSCICVWPIHWSQVLSWEWRCSWSSADRRCSNYIWVINNFTANSGVTYIRGVTVYGRMLAYMDCVPKFVLWNRNVVMLGEVNLMVAIFIYRNRNVMLTKFFVTDCVGGCHFEFNMCHMRPWKKKKKKKLYCASVGLFVVSYVEYRY